MAVQLTLRRRLSEASFSRSIALNGVPSGDTTTSTIGKVYWRWEDEPDMEPQFLGQQTAGFDLVVPFDLKGRSIRLYLVSSTSKGAESVIDLKEAVQTVVNAGLTPEDELRDQMTRTLADFFDDATTITDESDFGGAQWEDLYRIDLDPDTFIRDGDEVRGDYHGIFAANTNQKELRIDFAGTQFGAVESLQNGGGWDVRVAVMRSGLNTVRCSAVFASETEVFPVAAEIGSVAFPGNLPLILQGRTETADGDVTAKHGKVIIVPSFPPDTPPTPDAILFFDEEVTFLSEVVTFTP